jgi:hypothetical protein
VTDEELAIWRAAYATAFVSESDWYRRNGYFDFDEALKRTSAELAASFADAAVAKLRKWRREEEPKTGIELPDYVKENWE